MSTLSSRIQALRVAGHSLAIIAATLSREEGRYYSRGAVAGLVHRAQLPKMERKPSQPRKRRKRSALQLKAGFGFTSGTPVKMKRTRPEPLPPARVEDADIPVTQRRMLVELTSKTCRWPCGDPLKPGFFYCGAAKDVTEVYCAHHRARAWRPER